MIDGNVNNQLVNGGRKSDQQNFYTQQMAFIFEPIKDWTINGKATW